MRYRLLVLDIDGTTVDSEKRLSKYTADTLIRLQEMGVRVVLASGRPPEGVYPIAEALEFEKFGSYILAFNGGKIIDFRRKECLFEKKLPRHIPLQLREEALRMEVGLAAYQEGRIIACTDPDPYMKKESEVTGLPIEYCRNLSEWAELNVNQCLLTGPPEELEIVEPVFAAKFLHQAQVFHSEPWYLEVTPKNVSKAYGLKHLLGMLGIPREEMMCCGDSYNDIAMLQYAGCGVAMANAPDKVKAIADYVTENDNDHDGVAEMVERFFREGFDLPHLT